MMRISATTRSRNAGLAAATSLVVLASMLANTPAVTAWEWQGSTRERQDVRAVAEAVAKVAREMMVQPQVMGGAVVVVALSDEPGVPGSPFIDARIAAPRAADRVGERLLDLPPPRC